MIYVVGKNLFPDGSLQGLTAGKGHDTARLTDLMLDVKRLLEVTQSPNVPDGH